MYPGVSTDVTICGTVDNNKDAQTPSKPKSIIQSLFLCYQYSSPNGIVLTIEQYTFSMYDPFALQVAMAPTRQKFVYISYKDELTTNWMYTENYHVKNSHNNTSVSHTTQTKTNAYEEIIE